MYLKNVNFTAFWQYRGGIWQNKKGYFAAFSVKN